MIVEDVAVTNPRKVINKFDYIANASDGCRLYRMNSHYSGLTYIIRISISEELYIIDKQLMYKLTDKFEESFNRALYTYIKKHLLGGNKK